MAHDEQTLTTFDVPDVQIREQAYYRKPKPGQCPDRIAYFVTGSVASCLQKRCTLIEKLGLFILATNELDSQRLLASEVLAVYKNQSHVEGAFGF